MLLQAFGFTIVRCLQKTSEVRNLHCSQTLLW